MLMLCWTQLCFSPELCVQLYRATELKRTTKKVDFLTKVIDTEASLPFDQAWSRASKKVGPSVSIDQEPEKCEPEGAFYMILMRSWSRAGEALSAQQ